AAWVFRIASNAIADRWQRNAKRREVPADALEEAGADDGTARRATGSRLAEGLPRDQRLVILRRFVDQRSIAEIAAELGRTEGAIKQLQFRALHSLRMRMRSTDE